MSRMAERYIEEGLRTDSHPGIMFRNGPAGRRAGLIGGPDVWEIVGGLRTVEQKGEARIAALAERLGLAASQVRTAIRYYGEYPDEVDAWMTANAADADILEAALERERELLD